MDKINFDLISQIHDNLWFSDLGLEIYGFRNNLSTTDINLINKKLKLINDTNYTNQEAFIKDLLNYAGVMKLIQPFADGNSRTIFKSYEIISQMKGFSFDIDKAMTSENISNYIPLFYSSNESCDEILIDKLSHFYNNQKKK